MKRVALGVTVSKIRLCDGSRWIAYSNSSAPTVRAGPQLPDQGRLLSLLSRQRSGPPSVCAAAVGHVRSIFDGEDGLRGEGRRRLHAVGGGDSIARSDGSRRGVGSGSGDGRGGVFPHGRRRRRSLAASFPWTHWPLLARTRFVGLWRGLSQARSWMHPLTSHESCCRDRPYRIIKGGAQQAVGLLVSSQNTRKRGLHGQLLDV